MVQFECVDAPAFWMVPQVGNFIGSAEGPVFFMAAFQRSVEDWLARTEEFFSPVVLVDPCSVTAAGEINGDISTFADDTFATRVVPEGDPVDALRLVELDDFHFNAAVSSGGWAQNKEKREIVPSFRSLTGAKKIEGLLRAKGFEGRVASTARHLGGMHSWNGCAAPELANRLKAMNVGWLELGGFWFEPAAFKIKREIFIGKIVEAAHSGGLAFCFSRKQFGQIDAKMSGFLRAMLRGQAFENSGEGEKSKWTNLMVFRRWRILPAFAEAALRRVKWLQAMVKAPAAHAQTRAALFGSLFEFSNLDENGLVAGGSPYAAAFQDSLLLFEGLSGWEDFFDQWDRVGRDWRKLFSDVETADLFTRAYAGILRQAFTGAWVPKKISNDTLGEETYGCEIVGCNEVF